MRTSARPEERDPDPVNAHSADRAAKDMKYRLRGQCKLGRSPPVELIRKRQY
jgi:hypothetical protein